MSFKEKKQLIDQLLKFLAPSFYPFPLPLLLHFPSLQKEKVIRNWVGERIFEPQMMHEVMKLHSSYQATLLLYLEIRETESPNITTANKFAL